MCPRCRPPYHLQPMYIWPPECTLDPTLTQAYDELMNQSATSIYADLLYALKELNLTSEAPEGGLYEACVCGQQLCSATALPAAAVLAG